MNEQKKPSVTNVGTADNVILILYGGRSTEHEISCRSASTILSTFANLPYTPELCGISKDGVWYHQDAVKQRQRAQEGLQLTIEVDRPVLSIVPGKGIFAAAKKIPCVCVFPVLHGSYGEDGTLQGLLEQARLPYIGADVSSSALSINKKYCKILWEAAGLPVLPFLSFEKHTSYDAIKECIHKTLQFPIFIKPNTSGSSIGISKVTNEIELKPALDLAFTYDTIILAERGIHCHEIEVSVIGNHDIVIFPPGEFITTQNFYSYDAKYKDPEGTRITIPASLKPETREHILLLAKQAYQCLGGKGLARVDFFVTEDEVIYLNEINTMPGFTSISMFPQLVVHGGVPLPNLMQELIRYAKERFSEQEMLQHSYQ